MSAPFDSSLAVPVAGGTLYVAGSGPAGSPDVVLAVHGITASHEAWRAIARELPQLWILAPDLRGRGRSAGLPPSTGLGDHVADLLAVLDHLRIERTVLAGHSMGAYVVARLAAEHPERVSAVVLVDGGAPVRVQRDGDPDETLQQTLGPALARLTMTFPSADAYVEFWRAHPAFKDAWNEDVDAYVRADLVRCDAGWRSVVSGRSVRADGRALLVDEATLTAAERVRAPLHVLRAPRGLLDDDKILVPDEALERLPGARAELVEDVNHYTILMGAGARRVAAAIRAAVDA